jgi:hypothetical protein
MGRSGSRRLPRSGSCSRGAAIALRRPRRVAAHPLGSGSELPQLPTGTTPSAWTSQCQSGCRLSRAALASLSRLGPSISAEPDCPGFSASTLPAAWSSTRSRLTKPWWPVVAFGREQQRVVARAHYCFDQPLSRSVPRSMPARPSGQAPHTLRRPLLLRLAEQRRAHRVDVGRGAATCGSPGRSSSPARAARRLDVVRCDRLVKASAGYCIASRRSSLGRRRAETAAYAHERRPEQLLVVLR